LESLVRMRIARRRFAKMRSAAIVAESWLRCIMAGRQLDSLNRNYRATLIQTHFRMTVAATTLKKCRTAAIVVQAIIRGALQRPKFQTALIERREEAKLENQVVALQRKLEEAETRRIDAERLAEERARRTIEEYRESAHEEKKEASFSTPVAEHNAEDPEDLLPTAGQLSAQQQTLMDESGKMLEYLRKEVFKLRSQNAQMRTDFDLLKDNNQRLMDANASAGASFAALNQHAKQLTRANDKQQVDVISLKKHNQKLAVVNVELKEELKMKQATYVAEVHSRLQYQKSMAKMTDMLQEKCRDTRLVEDILNVADTCEDSYMQGPTGIDATPTSLFATPPPGTKGSDTGLLTSIRSFWS
jgi:hypothetical protein